MSARKLRRACRTVLVVAALLVILGPSRPDRHDFDIPDISRRINAFTADLLKVCARGDDLPANAVLSPQSLFHCLAMSYVASGGTTREELARAFHFPDDDKALLTALADLRRGLHDADRHDRIDVTVAQSLWLDETYATFREDYVDRVREAFDAALHRVRFARKAETSDAINAWVARQTRGRITRSVLPEDFDSLSGPGIINEPALVTVNAVYFKADWASRFDKQATRSRPFRLNASDAAETPMMHQRSLLLYAENDTVKFLEIPYIDHQFSMVLLLPRDIVDIRDLLEEVTVDQCMALRRRAYEHTVDVLLPRFEMRGCLPARKALEALGVESAFDGRADFRRMIHRKPRADSIYIREIHHDAWIDVHEEGTEAAAATSTVHYSLGCSASPGPTPVEFHADHPFLFMIVHNASRSVLFAGWISDPRALEQHEAAAEAGP